MRENLQPVLCYLGTSPVDFAWEKLQKLLRFVQRGRILLRCGSASALSLPSLGVSSLDLGRLFTQAALFSCAMFFEMRFRRATATAGKKIWAGASAIDFLIQPPPETVRGRQAERRRARRRGQQNRWPPARTLDPARAAARPCRSRD